jgi:hypothetical protein
MICTCRPQSSAPPVTACRATRKRGLGEDPPGGTTTSDLDVQSRGLGEDPPGGTTTADLDVQSRDGSYKLWSRISDSASSEARKRGSGGGSPRRYDDSLT